MKAIPSLKEVWKFMVKEAKPYKFEFVEEIQPLRVNVAKRRIYVNKRVLMNVIKSLVEAGLNWKEVMRKNLMHEKAHEIYQHWVYKWKVGAADYGWLPSFLIDIMIDRIHYKNNKRYQKWLLADSRHAFRQTMKDLPKLFKNPSERPHFLYNQAAYWVATGAISLEEAVSAFPEKANYIMELSELMRKIEKEEDLDYAFLIARKLYLENFSLAQLR